MPATAFISLMRAATLCGGLANLEDMSMAAAVRHGASRFLAMVINWHPCVALHPARPVRDRPSLDDCVWSKRGDELLGSAFRVCDEE